MDLSELQAKHPDIYNAAVQAGTEQERARIQAIENMALPGMEALTNRAKFETGITAEALAVEMITAQKKKGIQNFNDAMKDAEPLNDVPASGNPQASGEEEEKSLLAFTAERAKSLRR